MTAIRTALVTGGTGGLGAAVTTHLLETGWRVVVPWVARTELGRLADHPGLHLVEADLSDEAQLRQAVSLAAAEESAPLFGVVNLVGGFTSGPRVHETPIEVLDAQLDLNVRTAYAVTHAALPHLLAGGGGSVVCMSTAATKRPFAGGAAYVASKAAVTALAETLAVEYAADGVRVNALLPVVIDTPANRAAMPDADRRSWSQPVEIARVIRFLLSDDGAAVTGASIPVTHVG
ncbi:SDR family oxidoreductase [Rhodococcus sp. 14C212]|uniref:SDR family NAD(P)-dependent oxidoreductase n=1 Tax=Rhodococcus sp. 14C212 TaxID=2711209 RepID=UPI0013EA6A09|nr:SDR family oxidoreductase [Rhodococcus sp. 14C212]NGP06247.1 SDR family oxidoreductase [Rhodococcus sp. 14C212]